MLNAGYYDLATPYYEGVYELNQLQIPDSLRSNIEMKFYESGHMVYANEPSLKALHANVTDFIRRATAQSARVRARRRRRSTARYHRTRLVRSPTGRRAIP